MSDTIRDLLRAAGERETVTITTEADVILDAIDALNHLAQHARDDCGHQAITRAGWRYSHRRLVEAAGRATSGRRVPALLAVMWLQCAMWTCIALIYPSVTVPVFLGVLTVGAMFWDWKASRHD